MEIYGLHFIKERIGTIVVVYTLILFIISLIWYKKRSNANYGRDNNNNVSANNIAQNVFYFY